MGAPPAQVAATSRILNMATGGLVYLDFLGELWICIEGACLHEHTSGFDVGLRKWESQTISSLGRLMPRDNQREAQICSNTLETVEND